MGEKYGSLVGRFHLAKEGLKEKWTEVKETGGLHAKANEFKEDVIKKMNHGDDQYDHLYRLASFKLFYIRLCLLKRLFTLVYFSLLFLMHRL